jgi:hypothetical protein
MKGIFLSSNRYWCLRLNILKFVRWYRKAEGVIEPPLVLWSTYSNLQTMNGSSFDKPADSMGLEYTFMAVRKRD